MLVEGLEIHGIKFVDWKDFTPALGDSASRIRPRADGQLRSRT